jgi:hypothetical protein
MEALRPGAVGEIFDDPARHAAGDAERVDELRLVKPERRPDPGCRRHRAEDRGRVEPRLVHEAGRDDREAADRLDPDRDPGERRAAVEAEALGDGEHRRHDDGTGMDRPALERVVEILAMRRRAVDERGARAVAGPGVPDDGAAALAIDAGERRSYVVGAARRKAQPDDVEHEGLAHPPQRRRQSLGRDADDRLGEKLGDGRS